MTVSQDDLIVNTFYTTYVFLITTGTITFIESLRTKEEKVRNILNLETCISVIAAFFYGKFVKDLDKGYVGEIGWMDRIISNGDEPRKGLANSLSN